jgi:hypothetical protein
VQGKTFPLTDADRQAIGPDAPEVVHYCQPCLRVLTQSRESGAQLLKGLYEMQLHLRGVANAREIAQTFHDKLLKATLKGMH